MLTLLGRRGEKKVRSGEEMKVSVLLTKLLTPSKTMKMAKVNQLQPNLSKEQLN
jgi:hypothetical protein